MPKPSTTPPPSGRRKKRRTEYWRKKKREQRERLRVEVTERFGEDAYRRLLSEDKRLQRIEDHSPIVFGDDGAIFAWETRRGLRPVSLKHGELPRYNVTIRTLSAEAAAYLNPSRSRADIEDGRPLSSYTPAELDAHAVAVRKILWELSFLYEPQSWGRQLRRAILHVEDDPGPADCIATLAYVLARGTYKAGGLGPFNEVIAGIVLQFVTSGPPLSERQEIRAILEHIKWIAAVIRGREQEARQLEEITKRFGADICRLLLIPDDGRPSILGANVGRADIVRSGFRPDVPDADAPLLDLEWTLHVLNNVLSDHWSLGKMEPYDLKAYTVSLAVVLWWYVGHENSPRNIVRMRRRRLGAVLHPAFDGAPERVLTLMAGLAVWFAGPEWTTTCLGEFAVRILVHLNVSGDPFDRNPLRSLLQQDLRTWHATIDRWLRSEWNIGETREAENEKDT